MPVQVSCHDYFNSLLIHLTGQLANVYISTRHHMLLQHDGTSPQWYSPEVGQWLSER
jgi:hypothetical protein